MTDVPSKRIVKKAVAPARPAEPTPNGSPAAPVKKAVAKSTAGPRPAPTPAATNDDELGDLRPGWSAAQESMDATSPYAASFRPAVGTQIIKILEPAPYASYRRHWIQRVGGMRAYTCMESYGRPCPLCDVDKPSHVAAFNIAVAGDGGEAVLKSWDCAVRLTQTLKSFAGDSKIGPLNKPGLYFAVSKTETQQRQQSQTLVSPVRERDLMEDYGVPPITEAQMERLMAKRYTNAIVQKPDPQELSDIAHELANEDVPGSSSGWN
jgi:hypothetical protein